MNRFISMNLTLADNSDFSIAGRRIGFEEEPYVVAELSANHNGSLDHALAIIEAIAESGADAVKLQTYTADTMTIDSEREEFQLVEGPWAGNNLYHLYQWAHTPWEWHETLFTRGRELGLAVFSTPFDITAVDFLEQFDPPAYKIASFEIVDLPLIEYAASKGRPIIISTGMASDTDVMEAVATARRAGSESICLLHCTSGYPTPADEADLRTIANLAVRYNVTPGLSDHTLESAVPVAAVALGACVIEKHATLSRADGGPDATFSLEPSELKALVHDTRVAWRALGRVRTEPRASESMHVSLRRSLYVVEEIQSGERLTPLNLRPIRPGNGLHPRHYKELLGKKVTRNIEKGTPLTWDLIQTSDNGVSR